MYISAEYAYGEMDSKITMVDLDTGQDFVLYYDSENAIGDLRWSPNGESIIFQSSTKVDDYFFVIEDYPNWKNNLFLIDKNGNLLDNLCETNEPYACVFQAWSPDGKQVMFTQLVGGQPKWMLYHVDTRTKNELSKGFGIGDSQWRWNHGEIQWIASATSEDISPKATASPIAMDQPEATSVTEQEDISISSQVQPDSRGRELNITVILVLCGAGLIVGSVVIIILMVRLSQKKN